MSSRCSDNSFTPLMLMVFLWWCWFSSNRRSHYKQTHLHMHRHVISTSPHTLLGPELFLHTRSASKCFQQHLKSLFHVRFALFCHPVQHFFFHIKTQCTAVNAFQDRRVCSVIHLCVTRAETIRVAGGRSEGGSKCVSVHLTWYSFFLF